MPRLIVKSAEGGLIIHELRGRITTVGRRPDNDIVLDDPTVSRDHAEITGDDKSYRLRDLNSTDGTTVNGRLIKEVDLKDGDVVRFAEVETTFRTTAPALLVAPESSRPPSGDAHPAPAMETAHAASRKPVLPMAICLLGTFLLGIGAVYLCTWIFAHPASAPAVRPVEATLLTRSEHNHREQIKNLQAQIDSLKIGAAKVKELQDQIDSLRIEAAKVKSFQAQIDSLRIDAATVKELQDQNGKLQSQLTEAKKAPLSTNTETHSKSPSGITETPGIQTTTEKEIETSGRDLTGHRLQMEGTFRRVDNSAVGTFLGNDPDYVGLSVHDKNGDLVQYVFASKAKYGGDLLKLKYGDKIRLTGFVRYLGGPGGLFGFFADEVSW